MSERVSLPSDQLNGSASGPHLLITGGVHGDEFEPMAAIRQLRQVLVQPDPDTTLRRGRVTLVPIVNQAAFLRGHRTADDGLDLARTCPGRADGSITERVAFALSELIRSADFFIDLHTGGTELSVQPMTGYMLHPQLDVLESQRQMAQAFNLPIVWGTSANLEGRSLSLARDAHVPAIYAEYHGSATCDENGVEAYIAGCLNIMSWLQMIDRPQPTRRVRYVIEDDRPASGHMQICNPSPLSGFFQPAVQLGSQIRVGELLGTVTDALGDKVCELRAEQTGILLVLRTFPRVKAGESVAVIMETDSI